MSLLVNAALRILTMWLDSAEEAVQMNTEVSRKYAVRWKAVGLINHDRILAGNTDLIDHYSFSGAPK